MLSQFNMLNRSQNFFRNVISYPNPVVFLLWLVFWGISSGPFFYSNSGWASDFHSARTDALGGAGHAGPLLNDAIYLNPSYASLLPAYSVETDYLWYTAGNVNAQGYSDYAGHMANVSIQDGRSELFQAGAAYTQKGDSRWINFGASRGFAQRYGVGIGGKVILPNDPSFGLPTITDSIFSFSGVATEWFQASLIVDNLFESGKAYNLYREFIIGTKINIKGLVLLYLDPHFMPDAPDHGPWGTEAGVEFTAFTDFYIRIGQFYNATIPNLNQRRGAGYGFGLGWIGPRIALDYGFSYSSDPLTMYSHNFDVAVFF